VNGIAEVWCESVNDYLGHLSRRFAEQGIELNIAVESGR